MNVYGHKSLSKAVGLVLFAGMFTLAASSAIAASYQGDFVADMWEAGDGYTGGLTNAKVVAYDVTGLSVAVCVANTSVFANDGWVDFDCTINGDFDASTIELVELQSKQLTEIFYVVEQSAGSFRLNSIVGQKRGYFSIPNLGDNEPDF